eukprot:2054437-Amphidinium_carterae.1
MCTNVDDMHSIASCQDLSLPLVAFRIMATVKTETNKIMEQYKFLLNGTVMNDAQASRYWHTDVKMHLNATNAPEWIRIRDFVDISQHSLYHTDVEDDTEVLHVHGNAASLEKGLNAGSLGAKFGFNSALQTVMHRMCHHHFKLSGEGLESGEESQPSKRLLYQSHEFLETDAAISMTRSSIRTFESFQTASAISESRMIGIESLKCMFDSSIPGANKVQSTLFAQSPEVYDQYKNFVDEMKTQMREELKRELTSEKEVKSDVNNSS